MKKITVIIVDDERAAREELKQALRNYTDLEVIGEAKNADEAKTHIETKNPDLVFLDIQMPEKSGFDLLESLDELPVIIFTTAFNEYAVQAFEINALDYLVKPVREERFAKAIEKIRKVFQAKGLADHEGSHDRQVFIRDGEHFYFVQLSDIYLVESLDNYTRLYFKTRKALLKRSLRQWETMLDATVFFRINRTQLINLKYIKTIHPFAKGRLSISLHTGEQLELSSRQSAKFKSLHGV